MDMEALTQMLANGWPLALIGFFLGALTGGLISRSGPSDVSPATRLPKGDDGLSALASEIESAKQLLAAEEEDADETAESLKNLDDAIKRANGRLKLIMKAVKRAK